MALSPVYFMPKPCPLLKFKRVELSTLQRGVFAHVEARQYARFYQGLGQLSGEDKITVLRAAFFYESNNLFFFNRYVRELLDAKRYGQAEQEVRLLPRKKWDASTYYNAAWAKIGQHKAGAAYDLLKTCQKIDWDIDLYFTAMAASNKLGKYEEALKIFAELSGHGALKDKINKHILEVVMIAFNGLRQYGKVLEISQRCEKKNWTKSMQGLVAAAIYNLGLAQNGQRVK